MTKFEVLLRVLKKVGYPNPNLNEFFEPLGYDEIEFLPDLISALGQEGAEEFIRRTIEKLNTPEGIKIDLSKSLYKGSYIYLKIENFFLDLDNGEDSIEVTYKWGDGKFTSPEVDDFLTKEEMLKNLDIDEYDDFLEICKNSASIFFFTNCGYFLTFA